MAVEKPTRRPKRKSFPIVLAATVSPLIDWQLIIDAWVKPDPKGPRPPGKHVRIRPGYLAHSCSAAINARLIPVSERKLPKPE